MCRKVIKQLDQKFHSADSLSDEEKFVLRMYFQRQKDLNAIKMTLFTVVGTSVLLASRLGRNTRSIRVAKSAAYLACPVVYYKSCSSLDDWTKKLQFDYMSQLVEESAMQ